MGLKSLTRIKDPLEQYAGSGPLLQIGWNKPPKQWPSDSSESLRLIFFFFFTRRGNQAFGFTIMSVDAQHSFTDLDRIIVFAIHH